MTAMAPDDAPVWPMCPLIDVTGSGVARPANAELMARISARSPFGVAVACAYSASTSSGRTPAAACASCIASASQRPDGSGDDGWWASASDA